MTYTDSKIVSFYTNKIHSNPEFYELEKKRVVKYQVQRYNNEDARTLQQTKATKTSTISNQSRLIYFYKVI